jgi:hypothetical protein
MKLFAYYQDSHTIFSLFFIDSYNDIIRTSVDNIHGLRDLLLCGHVRRVDQDDKQYVKSIYKLENMSLEELDSSYGHFGQ